MPSWPPLARAYGPEYAFTMGKRTIIPAAAILLAVVSAALAAEEPFFWKFSDGLDPAVWIVADNTFPGSASAFIPEDAQVVEGKLRLSIRKLKAKRHDRRYSGATIQSVRYFGYGTFTVRMRAPIASGTTGTFFLMNRWEPGNWFHKEIDIELLGKSRSAVQFNVHRFYAESGSAVGKPFVHTAPFDYGAEFHEYAIRWTKDRIDFFVDGALVNRYTENIPDEPLSILMNHWVADPGSDWAANWLGPFKERDLPSFTEYEWVRFEPEAALPAP